MRVGTVINIQKYSVHDGPGIRTTVFLKGCPLKCIWCHNPESHSMKQEIMFFQERCIGCGICAKKCPQKAVEIKNKYPITNDEVCILCGKCTEFCPKEAREYVGKKMTVEEVMKEIIKDEIFYEESNGGVTFSGGEPLLHVDFLNEVLKKCKEREIHTAIETSGFVSWQTIEKIIDKVDLFLYDIKHMNKEKHKKYVGGDNEIILNNLKRLSNYGSRIYIRMPIISGINDDDENIKSSLEFLSNIKMIQVNLLPYHKMGMDKYRRLNKEYILTGNEVPSQERMKEIENMFKKQKINVQIGG